MLKWKPAISSVTSRTVWCTFRLTKSVEDDKKKVLSFRGQAYKLGYAGSLFWSWNLCGIGVYCATESGFAEMLAGDFRNK